MGLNRIKSQYIRSPLTPKKAARLLVKMCADQWRSMSNKEWCEMIGANYKDIHPGLIANMKDWLLRAKVRVLFRERHYKKRFMRIGLRR